jgi:hypothetical protein
MDPLKNCHLFPFVNMDGNPAGLRSYILKTLYGMTGCTADEDEPVS